MEIMDVKEAPLVVQVGQKFFPWVTYKMEDHVFVYVCMNPKVDRAKLGGTKHYSFILREHTQLYRYLKNLPHEELYTTITTDILRRIRIEKDFGLFEGNTFSQKMAAAHGREFPQWFNEMIDKYDRIILSTLGNPKLHIESYTMFWVCMSYLFEKPIIHDSKKWRLKHFIPPRENGELNSINHKITKIISYPVTATTTETYLAYESNYATYYLFVLEEIIED